MSTDASLPLTASSGEFPDEGALASFAGATGWLNSAPLASADLAGRIVLVDFWTFTCVNWLRTLPYLVAWHRKYADAGLLIVGVHTPEFDFESEPENVELQARRLGIDYPIALDADYAVWDDFANHYWPAVYLADSRARIRYHHFGEEEYAQTERAIQQLLEAAGRAPVDRGLVSTEPNALEVAADWASLRSPETYLGYAQSSGFLGDDPRYYDRDHHYEGGAPLRLNSWNLTGGWTVTREAVVLNSAGGRIAFGFQARDVNLVMAPGPTGLRVPFRVYLDGVPVGPAHGTDVDVDGRGVLGDASTYQLIRQRGQVESRVFEIEFFETGVQAYCFTFG